MSQGLTDGFRLMRADIAVVARWLLDVWGPDGAWRALLALLLLSPLSASLQVAFPWMWQYVVDIIGAGASAVQVRELSLWMLLTGVGYAAVFTVLQGLRSVMNVYITRHARQRVLARMAEADLDALRTFRTGDLVARLHDDAGDKTSWYLCSGVFRAYESIFVATFVLLSLWRIAPGWSLWLLAPLPLLGILQALTQRALSERNAAVQAAISKSASEISSTFGAIRTVIASQLAPLQRARFAEAVIEQRDAEIRTAVLQQGLGLLYQCGWQLTAVLLLALGGLAVLRGEMTLGRYLALEGLAAALVTPMLDFGQLLSRLPQTAVALRRLDALVSLPKAAARRAPPEDPALAIEAAGIVLREGEQTLLGASGGISLSIRRGERIAITGRLGSGKTLLCEILVGIRGPTEGLVRIAGSVAPVPQDPSLLSGTLRENILLGRDLPDEALQRALDISQLSADLPRLPSGLDTLLGERGVSLSGGQRQRTAIARALVGSPDVLVLDDATSALDAGVESALWEALAQELPALTVIAVTHRQATLAGSDRVLMLEGGQIVRTV